MKTGNRWRVQSTASASKTKRLVSIEHLLKTAPIPSWGHSGDTDARFRLAAAAAGAFPGPGRYQTPGAWKRIPRGSKCRPEFCRAHVELEYAPAPRI